MLARDKLAPRAPPASTPTLQPILKYPSPTSMAPLGSGLTLLCIPARADARRGYHWGPADLEKALDAKTSKFVGGV